MLMFNTGPQHGEAIGNYRGDPLYHASLAPEEYRSLMDQTGFDAAAMIQALKERIEHPATLFID